MVCKQCGADVSADSSVCQYCGSQGTAPGKLIKQINISALAPQPGPIAPSASAVEQAIPGFSELKPYYQREFRKIFESQEIYKGKWNWAAFFWGPLWALTKGLVITGVIALLLCIFSSGVLTLPIGILYGVRGNYQYYALLKKQKQII